MGTRVSEMNPSMMSSLWSGKGELCDSAEMPHGDLTVVEAFVGSTTTQQDLALHQVMRHIAPYLLMSKHARKTHRKKSCWCWFYGTGCRHSEFDMSNIQFVLTNLQYVNIT